jgi:hypothetical protein
VIYKREWGGNSGGDDGTATNLVAVQLELAHTFDGHLLGGASIEGLIHVGESAAVWIDDKQMIYKRLALCREREIESIIT